MAVPAQFHFYEQSMSIVADRLAIIRAYPSTGSYLEAETIALHVRKTVENVVFGCLSVLEHSSPGLERLPTKDADKLLALLKAKNLLSLPKAQDVMPPPTGAAYKSQFSAAPSRDTSADDLKSAFSLASAIIHERHPERITPDAIAKMNSDIRASGLRLDGWLHTHVSFVAGNDGKLSAYVIQMGLRGRPGFMMQINKFN